MVRPIPAVFYASAVEQFTRFGGHNVIYFAYGIKHSALNKREATKRTREQACMQGSADAGARAHQAREGLPAKAHPDHTPL